MKVSPKQYAKLIYETTEGLKKDQVSGELIKIAELVKKNRDERKMRSIEMEFEKLLKEREGLVDASVVSSKELSKVKLGEIQKKIASQKGTKKEKVKLENIVDENIKGGLVVRIENEILDASVLNRVNKLSANLS